ncbi:DNA modification methylase, partial [bacterium (Candidatus Howlettbacteria) CG_4_10_14_0_8_um_filter_40_9]
MYTRTRREEYDYRGTPLTFGRHKIHNYPAMLHYLLVRDLINSYSKAGDNILDPFCGSGVTILESLLLDRNSYGIEINPLALLIAKVKTTDYDWDKIIKLLTILEKKWETLDSATPAVTNLEFWYSPNTINELGKIRLFIQNITD